jgi:peptide/nickel transport system ATP-binding protein
VPEPSQRGLNQCIYAPRCDYKDEICVSNSPFILKITDSHFAKCFHVDKVKSDQRKSNGYQAMMSASSENDGDKASALKIDGLKTYYRRQSDSLLSLFGMDRKLFVKALDGITFQAPSNRTFSIVGESGCGKSTFLKTIIGMEQSRSGKASYLEYDLTIPLKRRSKILIKNMQMVFQNPDSTLNPSFSVGGQIARRLRRFRIVPKNKIKQKVFELLKTVRLDEYYYDRLPRQLSGGEKQRVAIARALASEPFLMLCDEPLSALDVSVQASIINLLGLLQNKFDTTILLVSHDLSVVRYISDFVGVMYMGKLMEIGPAANIYAPPYHPYTESLLSSVPTIDLNIKKRKIRLRGNVPSALDPPAGCPFHTRCPRRFEMLENPAICEETVPIWQTFGRGHNIFCHIPCDRLERVADIVYQT